MRLTVLGWVLVGMTFAVPAAAQHDRRPPSERPPHAGTPMVCCTGWTVSVEPGWPADFPDLELSYQGIFPRSWSVVTVRVSPTSPTWDGYAVVVPGFAASIRVWDPSAGEVAVGRTGWAPGMLNSIQDRLFLTTHVNAVGGQLSGGGILAVVHAGHLPDEFRVAVQAANQKRWSVMTVRRTPGL